MTDNMANDQSSSDPALNLSPADAQVLEALLAVRRGEQVAEPMPADHGQRANNMEQLLSLLDHHRVYEPSVDLVDRSMAQIRHAAQRRRFAQQITKLAGPTVRFGWYELGAVAASLILIASLALPMLSKHKADARRIACASGLQSVGASMAAYASDYQNALPRGRVAPGAIWYRIGLAPAEDGSYQSNSSHLYLLIRDRYADANSLACPENAFAPQSLAADAYDWHNHAQLSYSYHNQFTPYTLHMDDWPHMAVLADKNPLFDIRPGQPLALRRNVATDSPSIMHTGGQNVLTADGTVLWRRAPVVSGDNIWAITGVSEYKGNEAPTKPGDAHLIP